MKRLCALTLFSLLTLLTFGQSARISGKLIDDKGTPVRYANVSLLNSGKSLAGNALTDSLGKFELPIPAAGTYLLRFTAIGFQELKTENFEISSGQAKDFEAIVIQADTKNLNNVTVTALRPTIIQKADRMVVSVEGTAMAGGNTAFSVLSKAPGVFIDGEGNIQLNGRSGVTVMIDNRLTYLSARDLRNLLESMSAENIKNIEIITNPSAKFDAEGTSGIININLKKNMLRGMNGSLYTSYNYNFKQQHGAAAGGNIFFKSGRWNSFLNADFNRRVGGREATFTRVFYGTNQTTYFDQVATGNFLVQGPPAIRSGADYSFNDKHSIGFLANFTRSTGEQDFITDTYIGSAPKQPAQYIAANNVSKNTFTNFTGNVHYTGKLDTLGTQLSTDLDYVRITNRGEADLYNYFTSLSTSQTEQDILYTNTPNGFHIYSARIDFILPLNKDHKLEMGGKGSRIDSDNDFRFYFNNNGLQLDPNRTNHFLYKERIYAGYLNWNGTLSPKVSMQTGLRMEHTNSLGNSLTINKVTARKYTNLFPSVFVQQKVSENYNVNYSYSRRLTRPNYGSLNPFRAYRDPYTWYEGNTQLRPQYTHVLSVTQTIKKVYNVILNYYHNKDIMAEIPILLVEDTTTIYTTGNVNDGYSAGMTAIAPLKVAKKWDSQNTLTLSYSKFSMNSNNGLVENAQLFVMLQSNHTILLPKDIRAEVNLIFRGPQASGLYHMASMHRVDLAFKKSFFNKKFDLTINANDIFKGFRYFWTTDINGNVNEFDQYFRIRTVGFSLRYNFSKGQKVNLKQRTSIEELNRT